MKTKKKIQAYWFGEYLRYGDNRIPRKGRTHRVKGHPRLCEHGLHASIHPFDALYYASCYKLWMVELSGEVFKGVDNLVATERTYIKSIEIKEVAYKFSRWCALRVLKNWGTKPPDVVIQYLKTGDKSLRGAAESAAWRAAWRAAWSAAWRAAESAPWRAAWRAERKAQRRKFKQLVEEAFANAS